MGGNSRRLGVATATLLLIGAMGVRSGAGVPLTVTRFDDPVPDGCGAGDCSLREAIIAANAAMDADTISLQAGTYTLQRPGSDEDAAGDGDLDIRQDLTISGAGTTATTIDGNSVVTGERVFDAGGTPTNIVDVAISDLTIRGGTGQSRGVQALEYVRSTLSRLLVTGNSGTGSYGTVYNGFESIMMLTDSAVIDNDTTGGNGAGVTNDYTGVMTIRRTTISGNDAGGTKGGGVFGRGTTALTIEDSTISDNSVVTEGGGGLFLEDDATATITNATISGNRSNAHGGGILVDDDATLILASSTVTQNGADVDGGNDGDGGGIFIRAGGAPSVTIRNTIIAGNTDPTSDPDCFGSVATADHTILGVDSAGCNFPTGATNLAGTPGAPIDPALGPLSDNGGPTPTHALAPGSPATNLDGAGCPASDQRGAPRDGSCDAGAYELVRCKGTTVNHVGAAGKDKLRGTSGRDGMLGLGGKDTLSGLGGRDALCGGPGKDTLRGGGGKDRLAGQGGKDVCIGGPGRDRAACERERTV